MMHAKIRVVDNVTGAKGIKTWFNQLEQPARFSKMFIFNRCTTLPVETKWVLGSYYLYFCLINVLITNV